MERAGASNRARETRPAAEAEIERPGQAHSQEPRVQALEGEVVGRERPASGNLQALIAVEMLDEAQKPLSRGEIRRGGAEAAMPFERASGEAQRAITRKRPLARARIRRERQGAGIGGLHRDLHLAAAERIARRDRKPDLIEEAWASGALRAISPALGTKSAPSVALASI